jgi:hypothetical protein
MENNSFTGGLPDYLFPNFILLDYNNNNFIYLMGNDFIPYELAFIPFILYAITRAFNSVSLIKKIGDYLGR